MRDSIIEARLAQRIAHRWLYWEPFIVRRYGTAYRHLKERHGLLIEDCLRRGLPWTTIVNNKLDEPDIAISTFEFNRNSALEIRRQKKAGHQCRRKQKQLITKP